MWLRVFTGFALLATPQVAAAQAQGGAVERGRQLYGEHCAECHGLEGRGDGPTAERLGITPRDFTVGAFKCRSTPTGAAPTDEDLLRVIERGLRGTPMLGFANKLGRDDREAVVAYLEVLSPSLATRGESEVLEVPASPVSMEPLVAEGQAVYGLLRCWNCHGVDGKGKGPAAAGLVDDFGNRLRVYDFTRGKRFKCGSEDGDLYRLLHTGMTGSPMPSFTTAFAFGADQVGDVAALEPVLGPAAVATIAEWLEMQPDADEIERLDVAGLQTLVDDRTWSLIAFLRSLEGARRAP